MQHQITICLDDSLYQPLMREVGQENLNEFFSSLIKPYLLFKHQPPKSEGFLGLTKGDVKILDEVISPVLNEQEWTAMQ